MDFESAQQFLDGRISYERLNNFDYDAENMNLTRFRDFLRRAGVDFASLKYIHVAGSKGKGTVSSMFSDFLFRKGAKVGLFTSPHIHEVTERIRLNGEPMSQANFAGCIAQLADFVEEETYFELLNAAALKFFVDLGVDYAVLEVGLGGRLDSTNVVNAELSVITRLELEHTEILGDTLEEIAREKLGIVKGDEMVVIGKQSGEGSEIVRRLCPQAKFVEVEGGVFAQNASLVRLGLEELEEFDEAIFEEMLVNFKMKGRYDVREIDGKTVIFDMAHTEASIGALYERAKEEFPGCEFVTLFALLKGKNLEAIAPVVAENSVKVICTNSHEERGMAAEELVGRFDGGVVAEDAGEALKVVLSELNKNQLLVVAGSTYLLEKTLPRS